MNDTTMKSTRMIPLTLLRVGVGFIMAFHGGLKLWDMAATQQSFASMGLPLPEIATVLSVIAELGGGLALMFGLLTPLGAALLLANMLVAIFFVHIGNGLLARDGGFEYPLTIALVALFFLFRGAGPISLDALLARKSKDRTSMKSAALGRHTTETSS